MPSCILSGADHCLAQQQLPVDQVCGLSSRSVGGGQGVECILIERPATAIDVARCI